MILSWPESTITWEAVRDVVRKKYPDAVWKRQTLAKNEDLLSAFQDTKRRLLREREEAAGNERIAGGKTEKRSWPKSGTDEFYQDRVAFLEARIREFETENTRLKEQFARWQRNAFTAGMTMQQLDRPLLPIDRGQADE